MALAINCTKTGQDPVEKPPGTVTVAGLNHYWDRVRERAELEGARIHDLCHASQLCARNDTRGLRRSCCSPGACSRSRGASTAPSSSTRAGDSPCASVSPPSHRR